MFSLGLAYTHLIEARSADGEIEVNKSHLNAFLQDVAYLHFRRLLARRRLASSAELAA